MCDPFVETTQLILKVTWVTAFALVDFHYCHGNKNKIFIKELVYVSANFVVYNYFLFRPPFGEKKLDGETKDQNVFVLRLFMV